MRLRTFIMRILVTVGWGAFWIYAMVTKQEQDWRSMFKVACFVLFAQSFLRIGDDE